MFEDSFIRMLQQYPGATSDRKRFIGLLKDFFPEQQMLVNLISIAYDLGIAQELNKAAHISNAFAFRFVKSLMNQYGVSRVNADWAISVWCVCYGKNTLHKTCDIELRKTQSNAAPAIRDEQGATGRQYSDLFSFRTISEGYGISGFNRDNMRTLILPNTHNGKPVTRILAGAFAGSEVQEAVFTEGIKVIEEGAFKGCTNLTQVIFPGTLKEIGDAAFSGCTNLVTAALPRALEQIGRYSFSGTAIKQLDLPDALLWIGDGTYMDCTKLGNVNLPKHIVELPPQVFKGCSVLRKLTLPDGLLSIGSEAFSGCSGLLDLFVPETVSTVGDNAFTGVSPEFSLICTMRSAAEQYARRQNVPFQITL